MGHFSQVYYILMPVLNVMLGKPQCATAFQQHELAKLFSSDRGIQEALQLQSNSVIHSTHTVNLPLSVMGFIAMYLAFISSNHEMFHDCNMVQGSSSSWTEASLTGEQKD